MLRQLGILPYAPSHQEIQQQYRLLKVYRISSYEKNNANLAYTIVPTRVDKNTCKIN